MSAATPSTTTDTQGITGNPITVPLTAYTLVSSYSTVQVASPTAILDVVYCTIQTNPHGVTAAFPVAQDVFDQGNAGPTLSAFAKNIEAIMEDSRVIAGVGSQTIDDSGLLSDNVVFTVQFIDQLLAPNGATALATVGVNLLSSQFTPHQGESATSAGAIIDAVYANLQAAAGG